MQIIAQSLVPVNPTGYLHLGYISSYAQYHETETVTSTAPIAYWLMGALIALGLCIAIIWRRTWGIAGIAIILFSMLIPIFLRTFAQHPTA
jgi:hypothetical protein